MTLNGDYALCFKLCTSGAHHKNLNEDTYYLRKKRSSISFFVFWQLVYKVYEDIRRGSLETSVKQQLVLETAIFSAFGQFGGYIFGKF